MLYSFKGLYLIGLIIFYILEIMSADIQVQNMKKVFKIQDWFELLLLFNSV